MLVCSLYVWQRYLRNSNKGYIHYTLLKGVHTAQKYCTCMLCEHSQDTYSTYTWLKKTWKYALKERNIIICILWGFHPCNIEPTTKQTCLSMNETHCYVRFKSNLCHFVGPNSHNAAKYYVPSWRELQEKTREPSMEGQSWQREGL